MRRGRRGKAAPAFLGAAGFWLLGGGVAGAEGVPARASSYINPDVGLATANPDVSADSDCGNPDQVDVQRIRTTNVHNDACLFTANAPIGADESDVDAPASFQLLGVGSIVACPDPDAMGPKTARLRDTNGDGRNDLCSQSGFSRGVPTVIGSTTPDCSRPHLERRWSSSATIPTPTVASTRAWSATPSWSGSPSRESSQHGGGCHERVPASVPAGHVSFLPVGHRQQFCSPNGVRTRVSTLRGWCPRPLDDGAVTAWGLHAG